jgi:anti-sigma regulatory factor (Ser/Thr protein kinase)
MTTATPTHDAYRHSVLVHDTDEELVEATRYFVARGLASGAEVLFHSSRDRVNLLRGALAPHRRLQFALDDDLYQAPMRTLFAYQHQLAERSQATEVWVTGTVPAGDTDASRAAWSRYEAAVDEALGTFPFVALCTYDTRTRAAEQVQAALATHRSVNVDLTDRANPDYLEPATFLRTPLAQRLEVPTATPVAAITISYLDQLSGARELLTAEACGDSGVSPHAVEQLRFATHEVAANGLLHGRPPVRVTLWTEPGRLTCLVEDSGAGDLHPMAGYRHPAEASHLGLWASRQMVDDLVIDVSPAGGCCVLLTVTDESS